MPRMYENRLVIPNGKSVVMLAYRAGHVGTHATCVRLRRSVVKEVKHANQADREDERGSRHGFQLDGTCLMKHIFAGHWQYWKGWGMVP